MKQEEKELLLQDLCARLPYGVYGNYLNSDGSLSDDKLLKRVKIGYHDLICADGRDGMVLNGFLKPYLFPISSMTEEQREEFLNIQTEERQILLNALIEYKSGKYDKIPIIAPYKQIDWLNKNHFDYRGLIERGLAIDATNLNIY